MRKPVHAKKSLGQHFLKDPEIAKRIADEFMAQNTTPVFLEIGPGTGMLTKYFINQQKAKFYAIEADNRMIAVLREEFPAHQHSFIYHDFLDFDLNSLNATEIAIVGNFPYNISSQILFRTLKHKNMIPFLMGMFQKEVAQRIAAGHGNKQYGILSILIQVYYEVKLIFDVGPESFYPAPKVQSAVIILKRKKIFPVIADEQLFIQLVKAGFNQRRKTLRNSLGKILNSGILKDPVFSKRAEQLSVEDWIALANEPGNFRAEVTQLPSN
ncbi:MAG: 16S rRNA (adenine(1518)-N(6)/adenine(1519)-N(6))-dimethyltransferase RsmA [Chitinophagales bacterium]